MKKVFFLLLTALMVTGHVCSQVISLADGFDHPQDSARTKLWWFFGETETTREGITADLEAFKQQGVGGVVYYDQVHGKGEGADKVFDSHWWQSLIFASQEAKRLGLSFEANIGNGYVAGGRWITPDRSMQRLAVSEQVVTAPKKDGVKVRLGLPRCPQNWHHDVAVLAVPYKKELLADSRLLNVVPTDGADHVQIFDFGTPFTARSMTYEATPQGKARTSSMQVPPFAPRTDMKKGKTTEWSFFGCGFRELPDIGVLEVSDDGVNYTKVCDLHAKYQNLGGVRQQTVAFPTMTGRYFRVRVTTAEKVKIENVVLSARACVDEWEEKASLVSEFNDTDRTPKYHKEEMVQTADIVDLTDKVAADGTLTWNEAPQGDWLVMRFVSVTTGGHIKHGRAEALGLECDKLSIEGARLHWRSYTKPVIDSIRAYGGALEGICMDSHEAGPQNWTQNMEQEFRRLRGYDIRPFLPIVAAGLQVLASGKRQSRAGGGGSQILTDLRRTISDLITENYYGEFNRLCREEGLTLTAQAIGGALCMAGDAIEVKKLVDKPQGEFWGYQTEGNYDIKECSSAAHVYGKQIASGEAFTDITYKHSLADIKNLAYYAYCFGINEFVVCAVAYQADPAGKRINTANGRQYVLNRLNTQWPMSRAFWDYQARCSWMLRQGKPVSDVCIYLGDNLPARIVSHKLPPLPQGYDFDALGTDALLNRLTATNGRLVLPDGVSYRLLVLPSDGELIAEVRQKVDEWRSQGVPVYDPRGGLSFSDCLRQAGMQPDVEAPAARHLYFCHRQTDQEDIYFLNNHSDQTVSDSFRFRTAAASAELWNPVTGERTPLPMTSEAGRTAIDLTFAPRESYFIILSNGKARTNTDKAKLREALHKAATPIMISNDWTVTFDESVGGPSEPVTFDKLTDWAQNSDPRIKFYSGTAVYNNTFLLGKKSKSASYHLAIGQPGSAAQVFVNGKEVGTIWCSPWTLDITSYVKKGKNQLEIRVANSLWNRLVGDANKPEADRIMQQTHPLAKPSDKLVPSGLMGKIEVVTWE